MMLDEKTTTHNTKKNSNISENKEKKRGGCREMGWRHNKKRGRRTSCRQGQDFHSAEKIRKTDNCEVRGRTGKNHELLKLPGWCILNAAGGGGRMPNL